VFPVALPNCEGDLVGLGLDQADVHIHMANGLRKCSPWSSDHDDSRLDGDRYAIGNLQFFSFEDITHLRRCRLANGSSRYLVCRVAHPS
jgi:hypothetical protein